MQHPDTGRTGGTRPKGEPELFPIDTHLHATQKQLESMKERSSAPLDKAAFVSLEEHVFQLTTRIQALANQTLKQMEAGKVTKPSSDDSKRIPFSQDNQAGFRNKATNDMNYLMYLVHSAYKKWKTEEWLPAPSPVESADTADGTDGTKVTKGSYQQEPKELPVIYVGYQDENESYESKQKRWFGTMDMERLKAYNATKLKERKDRVDEPVNRLAAQVDEAKQRAQSARARHDLYKAMQFDLEVNRLEREWKTALETRNRELRKWKEEEEDELLKELNDRNWMMLAAKDVEPLAKKRQELYPFSGMTTESYGVVSGWQIWAAYLYLRSRNNKVIERAGTAYQSLRQRELETFQAYRGLLRKEKKEKEEKPEEQHVKKRTTTRKSTTKPKA
jgi:hypothetical protein